MYKKIISLLIVFAMLFSSISSAFANTTSSTNKEKETSSEENVALSIDRVIGSGDIVCDVHEKNNNYYAYSDSFDVAVQSGEKNSIMMNGVEPIQMGLPNQVANSKGVLTGNGTLVYTSNQNMSIAVQVLKSSTKDFFEGVRTIISIENANAPREYRFPFDLPEGYYLVKDYDYDDSEDQYDCGAVFIVNSDNEVISVIDPAWAKDINGNDVDTYYTIDGNTLVQNITFDDSFAFPIIADPTNHPNIPHYKYYTKNQIKQLRSECTNSTIPDFVDLLMEIAGRIPFVGVFISTAYNSIKLGETTYRINKYIVWNSIYNDFTKTYAKVNFPERWHSGHRCYYPSTIARFVCYTNSKS